MGAFDNTSLGSLWVYLLGIIFLVLAGLGLSFLSDGLIGIGSTSVDTNTINMKLVDIKSKNEELNKKVNFLNAEYQTKKAERQRRTASTASVEALKKQLQEASGELILLKKSLASETESFTQLNQDYEDLRDQSRAILWASGRGRSLNNIPNPTGGFYEEAKISKIDKEGILFRHRSGTARLQLPQIPEPLIEEFDLRP